MIPKKIVSFLPIVALLAISLSVFPSEAMADQSTAASAIESAQSQIVICYNVAKEAEAAGANITALTEVLNKAGLLQSQAQLAFSNGDFGGAQNYAVESQNKLVAFTSDANALIFDAENKRNHDFLVNAVGSMGGTVAILLGSFGLWSFLKNKYQ